jgi:hypothetical protein
MEEHNSLLKPKPFQLFEPTPLLDRTRAVVAFPANSLEKFYRPFDYRTPILLLMLRGSADFAQFDSDNQLMNMASAYFLAPKRLGWPAKAR